MVGAVPNSQALNSNLQEANKGVYREYRELERWLDYGFGSKR